jgi:hypothetical protein
MEKVFTRLAVRAGYTAMTPEIRGVMTKMVQFYAPLIQQYGNHLLGILFRFLSFSLSLFLSFSLFSSSFSISL